MEKKLIRNFSIIAHIDHGKSTLADRMLEITNTVPKRKMQNQFLDEMELEREKGITIKAKTVTMVYKYQNQEYMINLIDTPGHVDFAYEVSRSLAACEGALLVIDSTQGIQAQTMANVLLAMENDLEIIPVLNKIDLPSSDIENTKKQINDILGIDTTNILLASAKTGEGVEKILQDIIKRIPPPKTSDDKLKALIFDSHYDPYRGILIYIRVFNGTIKKKDTIKMLSTKKEFEVTETGFFSPSETAVDMLNAGEVGYITANIKETSDIKIGDTITLKKDPTKTALKGFKLIQPVVFAGIYPIDSTNFTDLKDALKKIQLNDSALHLEQENSHALGFGFRCGFLGLLHLEIVCERIIRDFDIEIITTTPSVIYKFTLKDGTYKEIDNPTHMPTPEQIDKIEEPWVICHLMIPPHFLGDMMSLGLEKRGTLTKTENIDDKNILLTYEFPLNEIIIDFNDKLKSITKGYGSFDYEFDKYMKSDIVKLEIKINDEPADAFSSFVHQSKAPAKGKAICAKLKELIPRQLFKVPIQAYIGGKIISRETISPMSKNVTAKCYGGDITRKRKLWDKQKKGKKKLKEIGKVQIPQKVFTEVLKIKF